jgi:hypothetical protein
VNRSVSATAVPAVKARRFRCPAPPAHATVDGAPLAAAAAAGAVPPAAALFPTAAAATHLMSHMRVDRRCSPPRNVKPTSHDMTRHDMALEGS